MGRGRRKGVWGKGGCSEKNRKGEVRNDGKRAERSKTIFILPWVGSARLRGKKIDKPMASFAKNFPREIGGGTAFPSKSKIGNQMKRERRLIECNKEKGKSTGTYGQREIEPGRQIKRIQKEGSLLRGSNIKEAKKRRTGEPGSVTRRQRKKEKSFRKSGGAHVPKRRGMGDSVVLRLNRRKRNDERTRAGGEECGWERRISSNAPVKKTSPQKETKLFTVGGLRIIVLPVRWGKKSSNASHSGRQRTRERRKRKKAESLANKTSAKNGSLGEISVTLGERREERGEIEGECHVNQRSNEGHT